MKRAAKYGKSNAGERRKAKRKLSNSWQGERAHQSRGFWRDQNSTTTQMDPDTFFKILIEKGYTSEKAMDAVEKKYNSRPGWG